MKMFCVAFLLVLATTAMLLSTSSGDGAVEHSLISGEEIGTRSVYSLLARRQARQAVPQNSSSGNNGTIFASEVEVSIDNYTIKVFSGKGNNEILNNTSVQYNKLKWYSIGHPVIVGAYGRMGQVVTHHRYRDGYYVKIRMLTTTHKTKIAKALSTRWGVPINESQILDLILSKFDCSINVTGLGNNKLTGAVSRFSKFPLRLRFSVKGKSLSEKTVIDRTLAKCPVLQCLATSKLKEEKVERLNLNAGQTNRMLQKLFDGNNKTSVYFTKNQLLTYGSEMHSEWETYGKSQTVFAKVVADELIQQVSY